MHRSAIRLSLLMASLLALTACKDADRTSPAGTSSSIASINQDKICETGEWRTVKDCAVGQKVAFFPANWGNEQLPVLFAAAQCDLRYSVVITTGAVTCIYKPIQREATPVATPEASAPSK